MRTYDYLLGLSMLALVACNQENMPERPTPTPGAEVKFGASLNKTDVTRTIYGEENAEKTAFPIYWVDGDKVLDETEVETVKVKSGFFDKLKAFFRALFNQLPVVVQEYLGVKMIDRVLP